MRPAFVLTLALLALLLPPGVGLLAAVGAAACGAGAVSVLGVGLLAAAPLVRATRDRETSLPPGASTMSSSSAATERAAAGAFRVTGVWREPPGRPAFLRTAAGPLHLGFASDVLAPPPGTPLDATVRVGATGTPSIVAMTARGPPRGAWLDRWSMGASRRVRELLNGEPGGLVSALVLGQRAELAFPVVADCRATGTMHLLALSGLHVALVAIALQRLAGIRKPLGVALVLLLFIALAGSRPPLQRAGLGWALATIGLRTGCAAASLHRLAVVALAMEAWQPGLHRELSAQLSFLAVAGLLATSRLARGPLAVFVAPSGAFLATAPLIAETFGVVQPFGLAATPLLVPLVGALMGLGLIAIVPGDLLAGLDLLTGPALSLCARGLREALATLAEWAPAPWEPPATSWPGWMISVVVVIALWMLPGRERRGGLVEVSAT